MSSIPRWQLLLTIQHWPLRMMFVKTSTSVEKQLSCLEVAFNLLRCRTSPNICGAVATGHKSALARAFITTIVK